MASLPQPRGVVTAAVPAHAENASEIDSALRTVFDSNDADCDGRLDTAEITVFIDKLFEPRDTTGDHLVSHGEFRRVGVTVLPLDQQYGRTLQYAAARERIWTLWRRKEQSAINPEMQKANSSRLRASGKR